MSRRQGLSRRGVLGVAAGGVLVVGFGLAGRGSAKTTTGFAPNAFLKIDTTGRVTAVLPKSEMGQGVYTALPMLLAEELDVPLAAVSVEIPPGEAKRFGKVSQVTGGSTSIRETYLPVRRAGAQARAMLVAAAAARWGVEAASCRTVEGRVEHPASRRSEAYGVLVADAAALTAPAEPPLKPAAAFQLIGKPQRRLDSRSKVDGSAVYGIDVQRPGLKVAAVTTAPTRGGRLKTLDSATALRVPGVRQVVQLEDGAAVVADHYWAALKGVEALAVVWDEGPNAGLNQAGIFADLRAASQREGAVAKDFADGGAAMKGAARHVEAVYEQPFLAHLALEPLNCTVEMKPGGCEVWTGTQVPEDAREAVARVAGAPIEAATLHNHLIGGGFGRRLEIDMVERAVSIAKQVRGPVKVIWSREEDIQHDRFRPAYVDRLRAGLNVSGQPVAWTHRIAGSSIMARLYPKFFKGVDADAVESAVDTPYGVGEARVEFVQQESPIVTSWWRGVGPLRSNFAVESFIDELAHAAGADPVAYRLGLLRDPRAKAVLTLAAEKSGWGGALAKGQGRGVSVLQAWGSYMAQVAEVEIVDKSIRVRRVTAVLDCGQVVNPLGVEAQVQGGVIFGVGAALNGEITIAKGRVEQSNFHDAPPPRMNEAPVVDVHLLASGEAPGGVGEPPTAGAAAAVTNAVFAATGRRLRALPLSRSFAA